jgi:hypothetical protein
MDQMACESSARHQCAEQGQYCPARLAAVKMGDAGMGGSRKWTMDGYSPADVKKFLMSGDYAASIKSGHDGQTR